MDVEHPPKLPKIKKLPKTKKHKLWKGKRVTKSEKKKQKLFATSIKLLVITFGFLIKTTYCLHPCEWMVRSYL
jgi:hypothetical protein